MTPLFGHFRHVYLHCTIWPPLLMLHSRLQICTSPASSSPPDSLKVLQWNAGGLRARSTELLHFLSSHPPVDLTTSRNPILIHLPHSGFSALRSDRTHSRFGILSPDAIHDSGGAVTFVRQDLSSSELSTSSLSSLDP